MFRSEDANSNDDDDAATEEVPLPWHPGLSQQVDTVARTLRP